MIVSPTRAMRDVAVHRRNDRSVPLAAATVMIAVLVLISPSARAQNGGDVSASIPESGAQALAGALAGATVEPSSGVLRATLPIAIPSARGASQPSFALTYSSANGLREAGVGWGLALPVIERSTRRGAPKLDDDLWKQYPQKPDPDELLFNGERLVPICEIGAARARCDLAADVFPSWADNPGTRYYRLENDTHARFFWAPNRLTWRIQLRGGETLELGQPAIASLLGGATTSDPDASVDYDLLSLV